jgi:hypothetical protein
MAKFNYSLDIADLQILRSALYKEGFRISDSSGDFIEFESTKYKNGDDIVSVNIDEFGETVILESTVDISSLLK